MIRLTLSVLAGVGTSLLVLDHLTPRHRSPRRRPSPITTVRATGSALVGGAIGWMLLGSPLVAVVTATGGALTPRLVVAREDRRRAEALSDAWPRLLDEARVLCGSAGLSMPQSLFTAARSGPSDLRAAWAMAEQAWVLSADFERSLAVLARRLPDPTTSVVCATLAVIHEAGGTSQHRQLARLAGDRRRDASTRRRAEAELAGARFARRFVLIVPAAMALAGQSIGSGRSAFADPMGQLAALIALAVTAGCWMWAGRLLAVPTVAGVAP